MGDDDQMGPPRYELAGHPQGGAPERCQRAGCIQTTGRGCGYVDRRGVRCRFANCADHQAVVRGRSYCGRHGTVISAVLEGHLDAAPLPDVANRAPGLVLTAGVVLDHRMGGLLQACDPGLAVRCSPVRLSAVGPERRRAWREQWATSSHTGHHTVVTIVVEEALPDQISLRVDGTEVATAMAATFRGAPARDGEVARLLIGLQAALELRATLDLRATGVGQPAGRRAP